MDIPWIWCICPDIDANPLITLDLTALDPQLHSLAVSHKLHAAAARTALAAGDRAAGQDGSPGGK